MSAPPASFSEYSSGSPGSCPGTPAGVDDARRMARVLRDSAVAFVLQESDAAVLQEFSDNWELRVLLCLVSGSYPLHQLLPADPQRAA